MIGQALYPDSTGQGLEQLARQGKQKLSAIALADKRADDTAPSSRDSLDQNDANKTPIRSPEENGAVIGKTLYAESTGKPTLPLANQVEARERAAVQAAPPTPDPQQGVRQTRQDRLKARTDRATAKIHQQSAAQEAEAQDRLQRMDALSPADQHRAARHGGGSIERGCQTC